MTLLDTMRAVLILGCWKREERIGQYLVAREAVAELVRHGFPESEAREALEAHCYKERTLEFYSPPSDHPVFGENHPPVYLERHAAMKAWVEEQQRIDAAPPERWSEPNFSSQWAKVFQCSVSTLRRRVKAGTLHIKRFSPRQWQIREDDLPSR